jgi:hypothetical protein
MQMLTDMLHSMMTDPIKTLLESIVAVLTITGVIWKGVLPVSRWFLRPQVVYAARIAEMIPPPPDGFRSVLGQYLPEVAFPCYSDDSIGRHHWPPNASAGSIELFGVMKASLSEQAISEVKRLEAKLPQGLSLIGKRTPEMDLAEKIARLRWFLVEECNGDYQTLATAVGASSCAALQMFEEKCTRMVSRMPTRIFALRVKNRSRRDATNLKIEITVGGSIYDVTVNERTTSEVLAVSGNRVFIKQDILPPAHLVDVKIWYRWRSVTFGVRTGQQSDQFKGLEGIFIEYIGVSNGKLRRASALLDDLSAWHSIEVSAGH